MGANCFLIRYAGGWAERKSAGSISTYGRQEALLGLGSITSLAEAFRVADGQLSDFAAPREQTDILIDPRWNAEAPYLGFGVGDTITVAGDTHRMLAVSVTEDPENDRVIFVPTLNQNVVLNSHERVAQTLQKMVRGTLGGRSKVAQPVVPVYVPRPQGRAGRVYLETFPNDGTLGVTTEDLTWNVEAVGGDPVVVGAKCTVAPSLGQARAEHDTSNADMYVQADLASTSNGDTLFLIGRAGDSSEIGNDQGVYIYVQRNASDTYIELGGWLPSGVIAFDTLASTANATWRLELDGTDARMLRDNAEVLAGTCSATPVGTRAGFQLFTPSTATIDNFEYGDL